MEKLGVEWENKGRGERVPVLLRTWAGAGERGSKGGGLLQGGKGKRGSSMGEPGSAGGHCQ